MNLIEQKIQGKIARLKQLKMLKENHWDKTRSDASKFILNVLLDCGIEKKQIILDAWEIETGKFKYSFKFPYDNVLFYFFYTVYDPDFFDCENELYLRTDIKELIDNVWEVNVCSAELSNLISDAIADVIAQKRFDGEVENEK